MRFAISVVVLPGCLLLGTISARADLVYDDFENVGDLTLVGNAAQVGDRLRLAPALEWQSGAVWHPAKQSVAGGFTTTFTFQVANPGGLVHPEDAEIGGDGLAFVIQNMRADALGLDGGGMGYKHIRTGIAIEFDMWRNYNDFVDDPDGNHISVQTGLFISEWHGSSLGCTSAIPDMSDGAVHTAVIDYVPGTMRIFLDDLESPALTVAIDLADSTVFVPAGETTDAWVGLTSASGAAYQDHDLLSWSFTSLPEPATSSLVLFGGLMLIKRRR